MGVLPLPCGLFARVLRQKAQAKVATVIPRTDKGTGASAAGSNAGFFAQGQNLLYSMIAQDTGRASRAFSRAVPRAVACRPFPARQRDSPTTRRHDILLGKAVTQGRGARSFRPVATRPAKPQPIRSKVAGSGVINELVKPKLVGEPEGPAFAWNES